MRIDYQFLKKVLDCYQKSEDIYVQKFSADLCEHTEKLNFHLLLLFDKGLIVSATGNPPIQVSAALGRERINHSIFPSRLTAYGYDFAAALNETAIDKIKEKGSSMGLDVALEFVKSLAKANAGL